MNPDKHLHHNDAVMVLNGMHDMANKGEITWYIAEEAVDVANFAMMILTIRSMCGSTDLR